MFYIPNNKHDTQKPDATNHEHSINRKEKEKKMKATPQNPSDNRRSERASDQPTSLEPLSLPRPTHAERKTRVPGKVGRKAAAAARARHKNIPTYVRAKRQLRRPSLPPRRRRRRSRSQREHELARMIQEREREREREPRRSRHYT